MTQPGESQEERSRVLTMLLRPWLVAKLVFKPAVGPSREERLLDRLSFWRATVGMVTIVVIASRYQGVLDPWPGVFMKMLQTGVVALLLPPLAFLVMLIITRPGHRAQLLPGALRLLARAAPALTIVSLPFLLLSLFPTPSIDLDGRLGLLAFLAAPFLLLWYFCFWGCIVYWAARTGMWTGEIHPLLAPIGTTLIMLLLNVTELWEGDSNGLPYWIWLTLNLCGTVTSLSLSTVEYRHLRSIGYRWRTGPDPMTRSTPVPMSSKVT
ncbi:hypothetical protein AB0J42_27540 [Nonomuraea sp. NPDC049649]|uniref:hypothetical protein n=1 Tax=Nonomuraea sp. NPDC049649 TaxID=3155776 RepID=UPI0034351F3C